MKNETPYLNLSQWLIRGLALVICCFALWASCSLPAIAAIRQIEEAPGQMVYQSRQTLMDQHGQSWQTIAFKRIHPNDQAPEKDGGEARVYLRLVAFPGAAEIDRTRPLTLASSLGQTLTAAEASGQIFTDANSPEPNVGQYEIQPVLSELRPELSWRLELPIVNDATIVLPLAPSLIQDWQAVAQS